MCLPFLPYSCLNAEFPLNQCTDPVWNSHRTRSSASRVDCPAVSSKISRISAGPYISIGKDTSHYVEHAIESAGKWDNPCSWTFEWDSLGLFFACGKSWSHWFCVHHQAGYYCSVCDCILRDSQSYLDHINGKWHNRALGMSMRVERSTVDQVCCSLLQSYFLVALKLLHLQMVWIYGCTSPFGKFRLLHWMFRPRDWDYYGGRYFTFLVSLVSGQLHVPCSPKL